MSWFCHSNATGAVRHDDEGAAVVRSLTKCLSLAAAPTFATMALLSAFAPGSPAGSFCATAASSLGGMVPMYLLMCTFHLVPWLKLISGGRGE